MSVKIIFVCHDNISVINVLKYDIDFTIIFVGENELNNELQKDSRIIVARTFEYNIEKHKELLTFTAWYLISKNNLFKNYDYICIFEWDACLSKQFLNSLHSITNMNNQDAVSFHSDNLFFYNDINVSVLNYFLKKINIDPNYFNSGSKWFSSTNQCLRRGILDEFVDVYFPLALTIKQLDYAHISWYHERIFSAYIIYHTRNVHTINNIVSHEQKGSHYSFRRQDKLPPQLTKLYIENDQCEYLNKLIIHYDIFNNLYQVCDHMLLDNTDLYLFDGKTYTYSDDLYEKQKLLYKTAKKCKNVLQIGTYMSHALFIMLLANPQIQITCMDNDNKFTRSTIKLLETKFNTNITFINNDELSLVKGEYDFVHINLLRTNTDTDIISKMKEMSKYLSTTADETYYLINHYDCYDKQLNNFINSNNVDPFYIINSQSSNGSKKCVVLCLMYLDTELKRLAYEFGTDKLKHGYIEIYETHLNALKYDIFNFLEIGVFFGSSIKMWEKYFPNAVIYGADHFTGRQGNGSRFTDPDLFWNEYIHSTDKYHNIDLIMLDQSSEQQLIHFKNNSQRKKLSFKVILDDASHLMRDQQLTFFYLFDLLESGGIFIIEDLHTSEQPDYDLLPDKSNSTKKIFENIQNGNIFKSIYIHDQAKCREITSQIEKMTFFKIKDGSEVLLIFKK